MKKEDVRKAAIFVILAGCLVALCLLGRLYASPDIVVPSDTSGNAAAVKAKQQGDDYQQNGQAVQAIAAYTVALSIDSQYAGAYYARGNSYVKNGQLDQGIADYTAALRIKPQNAELYDLRGHAYAKKGQKEQAIADYTAALRINSLDVDMYSTRGAAYAQNGQLDQAIADYTTALRINSSDIYSYVLHLNRAAVFCQKGQWAEAQLDYDMALRNRSCDAAAWYGKASVCEKLDDRSEAIKAYRQFVRYASSPADIQKVQQVKQRISDLGG